MKLISLQTSQTHWIPWRFSRNSQSQYLFLLSHMRSYSSLLAHVLGSSPEIDGYGEHHVRYKNARSLASLRRRVTRSIGHKPAGRWLLDKLLHNGLNPPDLLLNRSQFRTVIFMRKPEATLRSMLTRAVNEDLGSKARDPQWACDYYVSRLHRLRQDGERLGKDALYFQSECFINSPQPFLSALSSWLNLETPLDTSYHVGRQSGQVGFGDPSPNIRQGRVLGPESSTIKTEISIPSIVMREAQAAYERCNEALQRRCEAMPLYSQASQKQYARNRDCFIRDSEAVIAT